MHETSNGIEVRVLLPDAEKVFVLSKETKNVLCELSRVDERGFLPVLCLIRIVFCVSIRSLLK